MTSTVKQFNALFLALILHLIALIIFSFVSRYQATLEVDIVAVDLVKLPPFRPDRNIDLKFQKEVKSLDNSRFSSGFFRDSGSKQTALSTPQQVDPLLASESAIMAFSFNLDARPSKLNSPLLSGDDGLDPTHNSGVSMTEVDYKKFDSNPRLPNRLQTLKGLAALQPNHSPTEVEIKSPLARISAQIANYSRSKKVDLVFILDTSQSMRDNIKSVVAQLKDMASALTHGDVDFTLGLVRFHDGFGYQLLGWDVTITPQTKDVEKIADLLKSIRPKGDERALDALFKAASDVKFRPEAQKRFIFITDEYVKGSQPPPEVINQIKNMNITVDVIGVDEPFQRAISEQTGGTWDSISFIN